MIVVQRKLYQLVMDISICVGEVKPADGKRSMLLASLLDGRGQLQLMFNTAWHAFYERLLSVCVHVVVLEHVC